MEIQERVLLEASKIGATNIVKIMMEQPPCPLLISMALIQAFIYGKTETAGLLAEELNYNFVTAIKRIFRRRASRPLYTEEEREIFIDKLLDLMEQKKITLTFYELKDLLQFVSNGDKHLAKVVEYNLLYAKYSLLEFERLYRMVKYKTDESGLLPITNAVVKGFINRKL